MKELLLIWFLLVACITGYGQNEDNRDSLLLSFVYLKHGDVLVGSILRENDTSLVFFDQFMGEIHIRRKKVTRIEYVYAGTSVILSLGEGVRYSGELVDVNEENFVLASEYVERYEVPRNKVIDVQVIFGEKDLTNNPNATRYFFAPSAIPLRKGKGYYQNAYLLSNSANFGATDNFSFGGGVVIPLLFYITPKVGFKVRKNLYLGAGAIAATTFIPDIPISGGIPYGLLTVGNEEDNITLGAGYGLIWNNKQFQETNLPIITLNGMKRISNKFQLVSENWLIPYVKRTEEDNITYDLMGNPVYGEPTITESQEIYFAFSFGTRILFNKNATMDIAPLYLVGTASRGIMIPYLDFVYRF